MRPSVFLALLLLPGCGVDPTDSASDAGEGSVGDAALARADARGAADSAGAAKCVYQCTMKADCCEPGFDCTVYPYNANCVNARCALPGCSSEADCQQRNPSAYAGGPTSACRAVNGTPECVYPCASAADCTPNGTDCAGKDDDGGSYCIGNPGATILNPCGSGPQCWACTTDAECDGMHGVGLGVCILATHTCGCTVDSQCPQYRVVGAGRWVCGLN
jgi:hypothetical protein